MMNKVLVLGASSYLGQRLCKRFNPGQIVGTYYKSPVNRGIYFDALSMTLRNIVEHPEDIGHAVILVAQSNPNKCANNTQISRALNVEAIQSIIDQLVVWNIHPIFVSTEVVFDGKDAPYYETDSTRPLMTYGKQKLEIEKYIENKCDEYTIFRLSRIYGDAENDGTIFMDWIKTLEQKKRFRCANDQFFSPIFVDDVLDSLVTAIDRRLCGTYHIGGPRGLSRYDMLLCLIKEIEKYRIITTHIEPCSLSEFYFLEERPQDVTLNSTKVQDATSLKFRTVEKMCAHFAKHFYGKPTR